MIPAHLIRRDGHAVIAMRDLLPLPAGWEWTIVEEGIVEASRGASCCSVIDGRMVADNAPMDVVAAVVQRWERMCAAVAACKGAP